MEPMKNITVHGPQGGCGKTTLALALAGLGYGYASRDPLNEVAGEPMHGVLITDTSPYWVDENKKLVADADVLLLPITASAPWAMRDVARRISEVLEARLGKPTVVVRTSDAKAATETMGHLTGVLSRPGVTVLLDVVSVEDGECDSHAIAALATKLF